MPRLKPAGGLLALLIWSLSLSPALAAPGDLDTSFGQGGKSVINLGGVDFATAVALQPDGKILLAGATDAPPASSLDFLIARLTSEGALDPSYAGGSGWSDANVDGSDIANALVQQPDGRIVVAGQSTPSGSTNSDAGLARLLNPQGTFDPSLVGGGRLAIPFGFNDDSAHAVGMQGDKIILSGSGGGNCQVGRRDSDGSFDTSFAGGALTATVDFGATDGCNAMAVLPDGRIVLGGFSGSSFAVARLLPGGGPDGSFAGGGKSVLDLPGLVNALAIQPDGKIVLAGNSGNGIGVYRLLANGNPDNSFGNGGKVTVSLPDLVQGTGVAVQANGKIVVVGTDAHNPGLSVTADFAAVRLQPAGILDQGFGNSGKAIVDIGPFDNATGVALQKDGKIVIAGSRSPSLFGVSDLAVARLQGDPPGTASTRNAKCGGKKATIIGSGAKDKLKGTRKRDVIVGLGGKDTIKGLKGNDLICGGKGRDKLLGGPGNDKLLGQAGRDFLKGGPGKDKLRGGAGKDVQKP